MLADDTKDRITQQITDAGAGSPFVFTDNNAGKETLTGYKLTSNGVTTTEKVRKTEILGNDFIITLATFTPVLTAAGAPGATLNWDVPATGFGVTVDNPTDYTSKYIDAVTAIAALNGSSVSTTLADYSAGVKSATPAGGEHWTQAFSTNSNAHIYSSSTDATGGSASGRVTFSFSDGDTSSEYTTAKADFTVSWNSVNHAISITPLTGKTFLETYTSTSYTPSVTGLTNLSNKTYAISGTNGTPSSTTGAGTLTFSTALHKDNASTTDTKVTLTTTASRPSGVTGNAYQVTLGPTASDSVNSNASFSYPSFTIFTAGTATVPTRDNCVDGSALGASVYSTLGSQVKTFSGFVTNSSSDPRAFWFAVRASASQPATFKTGASADLLSNAAYTNGGTVGLAPDSVPSGYSAENYRFYGIILQPGQTYVSIS